jgi:MoxR-like ATPase
MVYHPSSGELTFRPGPVFTSVLVADELNRTPPRTQSALLQCMQEGVVTIDRQQHALPDPFFVIATQNPLTFAGTYPLPESQLDRFLMRIRIGYPEAAVETRIVTQPDGHRALGDLRPVADSDALRRARAQVDRVHVETDLVAYVVALAQRTRAMADVRLGISTRGAQALHRAARARAVALGRDHVVPDDVRELVGPVFGHRLQVRGGDGAADAALQELTHAVAAPE